MRGAWGVHVSEDGVGGSSRPLLDVVVWGLPSGNEAVVAVPNLGTLLGPRGQAGEVDTFITVLADYQVLLQNIKLICICAIPRLVGRNLASAFSLNTYYSRDTHCIPRHQSLM